MLALTRVDPSSIQRERPLTVEQQSFEFASRRTGSGRQYAFARLAGKRPLKTPTSSLWNAHRTGAIGQLRSFDRAFKRTFERRLRPDTGSSPVVYARQVIGHGSNSSPAPVLAIPVNRARRIWNRSLGRKVSGRAQQKVTPAVPRLIILLTLKRVARGRRGKQGSQSAFRVSSTIH